MSFRLAHFSDPHLSPLPWPRLDELFSKRILGLLNWARGRHRVHKSAILSALIADMQAQAPHMMALTGDLTNISLNHEYVRAAHWLASIAPPERLMLVPGNHDAYVEGALERALQHWAAYCASDTPHTNAPVFPSLRIKDHVALIGLSSAVPAPFIDATGEIGTAQLARCAQLLDQTAQQNLCRIVLLHHPLTVPLHRPRHRLLDAQNLREMLQHHGAELVLHGHMHSPDIEWIDQKIPVIGVPSSSADPAYAKHGAGYALYDIEKSGTIHMTRRSFSSSGAFISATQILRPASDR